MEVLIQICLNTKPLDQRLWHIHRHIKTDIDTYKILHAPDLWSNVFCFPSQFLFKKDLQTSTNFKIFWTPGPAVRSVATSRWSVPRPAGISYPEMPWKNLQSWHNRNRLHLHLWVSFSKLSILLLHLLRSQGDETVKGSVGGSKVSDAQNHLPRSKMLRSNNWNDLEFTGLLHSRQGIQVTCWTQWRWWWRHALKSTGDQLAFIPPLVGEGFDVASAKIPHPKNSESPPLPEMADWRCACQSLPAPWPKKQQPR